MAMNKDEQRGYSRGYQARADKWPAHRPPLLPEPIIANLMSSLIELRDICDNFRATLDPNDEFGIELEAGIDKADAALREVSTWLRKP